MTPLKLLGTCAGLTLLAGCGAHDIAELKSTQPTGGTPFTQALTSEYRSYVVEESDRERDWPNSYIFAGKGLAAAKGQAIAPEDPTRWHIPDAALPDLQAGRQRLLGKFGEGSQQTYPGLSARAQVSYDCWVEETEENWEPAEIATCRGAFEQALAAMTPPPPPPPQAQAPVAQEQAYTVYFAWDSAQLDGAAHQIVGQIARQIKAGTADSRINLAGHTDLSGSEDYNLRLSLRRADAVRSALIAQGISGDRLSVTALGETQPAVPTAKGVREARNRRVVITIR